jgi:hypothetical protein
MKPWCVVACAMWLAACTASSGSRELDNFSDLRAWKVIQSDQVTGTLRKDEGTDGAALCLDYDFHGVSGYVGVQRDLPLDYPANYAFDLQLRGTGVRNDFQFKLVDGSGDNVWWAVKPKFALPEEWTPIEFRKRHITKAWGPSPATELKHSAKLEFTLASGQGGRGSLCFDALTFTTLPLPPSGPLTGKLSQGAEGWTLDLGTQRELGGAILRWRKGAFARDYRVSASSDGKEWRPLREMHGADGGEDFIALPETDARYLRVAHTGAATLEAIDAQPLSFGATQNDFIAAVAKRAPRGEYPRGFIGEQPYWTIVGVDGGHDTALLGEDGAIELGKGAFTLEPVITARGKRATWAGVRATQSLQDGDLPMPSVHWTHPDFKLDITAFAEPRDDDARLIARYRLANTTREPMDYVFALRVRPFQVNPPSQFLNTTGGVSPLHNVLLHPRYVAVDNVPRAAVFPNADRVSATTFDGQGLPAAGAFVNDPTGLASGLFEYDVHLAPGEAAEFAWSSSLEGKEPTILKAGEAAAAQASVAAQWHDKLDRVRFTVPPQGQRIVDTLRTALAHMAISRVGPRLQPGTRSYSRAWIRDGAMIGEGLLRLGREDIATDFLRWYAPHQFDSGKVPCCVDDRGADPVPENDSHGEFVFLAAEVYRYTHDKELLKSMWPHVQGAVKYMDELRASERTEANRSTNAAFYGLMPASISHEGYSAKPMHSYWDDFWALRGYKDAVEIARWLGHEDDAKRFAVSRDQFAGDLRASLKNAMQQKGIAFLPGSAELGDFDATSTTIALAPGGEQANLPQDALLATFERYWTEFEQRRTNTRAWKDYTPYELRTIGTFVRLGWRDRAHSALDFFFRDQQPRAWNQWAEVVSRTPRKPFFLGDLPHAWVASDYVRSALDLFAFSRESDDALVVAGGIPGDWLVGQGVAVDGLRTPGGPLKYSLRGDAKRVQLAIDAGITPPKGGLVFPWPFKGAPGATTINGKPAQWTNNELRITQVPAKVAIAR